MPANSRWDLIRGLKGYLRCAERTLWQLQLTELVRHCEASSGCLWLTLSRRNDLTTAPQLNRRPATFKHNTITPEMIISPQEFLPMRLFFITTDSHASNNKIARFLQHVKWVGWGEWCRWLWSVVYFMVLCVCSQYLKTHTHTHTYHMLWHRACVRTYMYGLQR